MSKYVQLRFNHYMQCKICPGLSKLLDQTSITFSHMGCKRTSRLALSGWQQTDIFTSAGIVLLYGRFCEKRQLWSKHRLWYPNLPNSLQNLCHSRPIENGNIITFMNMGGLEIEFQLCLTYHPKDGLKHVRQLFIHKEKGWHTSPPGLFNITVTSS